MIGESPFLAGVTVIEVGEAVRVRYAGRVLAELGATVIRVEPPGRAPDRDQPWLDPAKRILRLALDREEGRELLARLVPRMDVLLEEGALALEPGVHERLIHAVVTPFGEDGPWAPRPAPDLIVSALSGMCLVNGFAGELPLREPGPQAEMVAALVAVIGILAALAERSVSGAGQRLDVSALEAMINVLSPCILQQSYQGGPKQRERGSEYLWRCADGWMSLVITAQQAWESITMALGLDLAGDPRFADERARRAHAADVRALLGPEVEKYTRRELFDLLAPLRVVCGMVLTPAELLEDPHLAARDAFVDVRDPAGARVARIPRLPLRARGEPLPGALPLPGEVDLASLSEAEKPR